MKSNTHNAILHVVFSIRERNRSPLVQSLKAVSTRKMRHYSPCFVKKAHRFLADSLRNAWRAVRVSRLTAANYYLPYAGHKTSDVDAFLPSIGGGRAHCEEILFDRRSGWKKTAFTSPRIWLRFVFLQAYLAVRCRGRLRRYKSDIATYLAFSKGLKELNNKIKVVVVADLSPELIAFCCALKNEGHETIGWQCDYLDPVKFPFEPTKAIVKNAHGLRMAKKDESSAGIIWQKYTGYRTISPVNLSKPIGLILMAFIDDATWNRINDLARKFGRRVLIRPHPRNATPPTVSCEDVLIDYSRQTLEQFVGKCGLVLVGNSTAQIKILQQGVPVVQVKGLDIFPFDIHGYVCKGLVFGSEQFSLRNVSEVDSFYKKKQWSETMSQLLHQGYQH